MLDTEKVGKSTIGPQRLFPGPLIEGPTDGLATAKRFWDRLADRVGHKWLLTIGSGDACHRRGRRLAVRLRAKQAAAATRDPGDPRAAVLAQSAIDRALPLVSPSSNLARVTVNPLCLRAFDSGLSDKAAIFECHAVGVFEAERLRPAMIDDVGGRHALRGGTRADRAMETKL